MWLIKKRCIQLLSIFLQSLVFYRLPHACLFSFLLFFSSCFSVCFILKKTSQSFVWFLFSPFSDFLVFIFLIKTASLPFQYQYFFLWYAFLSDLFFFLFCLWLFLCHWFFYFLRCGFLIQKFNSQSNTSFHQMFDFILYPFQSCNSILFHSYITMSNSVPVPVRPIGLPVPLPVLVPVLVPVSVSAFSCIVMFIFIF